MKLKIECRTGEYPGSGSIAGVTDMSFRQLCREQDCGLLVTEMVSAKGDSV